MALLFCDSFDHYNTATWPRKWTLSNTVAIGAFGRNGTQGARCASAGGAAGFATRNLGVSRQTLFFGAAVKPWGVLSGTGTKVMGFLDAGTFQLSMTINDAGDIKVYRGDVATLLGTAVAAITDLNSHQYIEIKAVFSSTVGAVQVRVNTLTVLNLTGIDTTGTANDFATQVRIGTAGFAGQSDFDDLYVCDDQGLYNNNFLGDVRVEAVWPDGAGNSTQYTPSAGSNHACVDETTPPNDDTDYVQSSTVGHVDLYTMGNITATTGVVHAVAINHMARKDDAGTRTARQVLRSAGSDTGASDYAPATSYSNYQGIFENIVTTPTLANAMECGSEVMS